MDSCAINQANILQAFSVHGWETGCGVSKLTIFSYSQALSTALLLGYSNGTPCGLQTLGIECKDVLSIGIYRF